MDNPTIIFIGIDTAKEHCDIAYTLDDRHHKPQHLGKIKSTKQGIEKMVKHFQSKFPQATLYFVYEAGPCGYWIYRLISRLRHDVSSVVKEW